MRILSTCREACVVLQATFRPENSHRSTPSPSALTSAMMLLVTLPKNGRLAPTRSAATIASASSINPISVSDPIQPLILCNASMCVLPISEEAPAVTHATHENCDNLQRQPN